MRSEAKSAEFAGAPEPQGITVGGKGGRTLKYITLWLVGAVAACQGKPERSWCGDGECAGGEDPERCPADCAEDGEDENRSDDDRYSKDGESEDSADDNGTDENRPEPKIVEEPCDWVRMRAEEKYGCLGYCCSNAIGCIGEAEGSDGTSVRESGGLPGRFESGSPPACDRNVMFEIWAASFDGELSLETDNGILAVDTKLMDCLPASGFPCDATSTLTMEVAAHTLYYWFIAGETDTEFTLEFDARKQ